MGQWVECMRVTVFIAVCAVLITAMMQPHSDTLASLSHNDALHIPLLRLSSLSTPPTTPFSPPRGTTLSVIAPGLNNAVFHDCEGKPVGTAAS